MCVRIFAGIYTQEKERRIGGGGEGQRKRETKINIMNLNDVLYSDWWAGYCQSTTMSTTSCRLLMSLCSTIALKCRVMRPKKASHGPLP
jgi:hypothetical protein